MVAAVCWLPPQWGGGGEKGGGVQAGRYGPGFVQAFSKRITTSSLLGKLQQQFALTADFLIQAVT